MHVASSQRRLARRPALLAAATRLPKTCAHATLRQAQDAPEQHPRAASACWAAQGEGAAAAKLHAHPDPAQGAVAAEGVVATVHRGPNGGMVRVGAHMTQFAADDVTGSAVEGVAGDISDDADADADDDADGGASSEATWPVWTAAPLLASSGTSGVAVFACCGSAAANLWGCLPLL